jgi:hypothetical protein
MALNFRSPTPLFEGAACVMNDAFPALLVQIFLINDRVNTKNCWGSESFCHSPPASRPWTIGFRFSFFFSAHSLAAIRVECWGLCILCSATYKQYSTTMMMMMIRSSGGAGCTASVRRCVVKNQATIASSLPSTPLKQRPPNTAEVLGVAPTIKSRLFSSTTSSRPLQRHAQYHSLATTTWQQQQQQLSRIHSQQRPAFGLFLSRALSSSNSSSSEGKKNADNATSSKDDAGNKDDGDPGSELVLTPGEKVVAYSRLGMWGGIAVFAGFCAYYIGKELFPT